MHAVNVYPWINMCRYSVIMICNNSNNNNTACVKEPRTYERIYEYVTTNLLTNEKDDNMIRA